MERLCRAPSLALAQIWCDVLNRAGIEVTLQRLYQQGVAGDIPLDQVDPELWLMDEAQFARAQELLSVLKNPPQRRWFCACGEEIEGGFEQCWNCGAMRLSL
ncbi:MAG: DUF2007 domain-containing protein [Casimicrobiaceae bacterium]